jgi:hypothetical protein
MYMTTVAARSPNVGPFLAGAAVATGFGAMSGAGLTMYGKGSPRSVGVAAAMFGASALAGYLVAHTSKDDPIRVGALGAIAAPIAVGLGATLIGARTGLIKPHELGETVAVVIGVGFFGGLFVGGSSASLGGEVAGKLRHH